MQYRQWQLAVPEPRPFASFEEVPFTFVDTLERFSQFLQALERDDVRELAVDLEHHSLRSFRGFLCLMQVGCSTAMTAWKCGGDVTFPSP